MKITLGTKTILTGDGLIPDLTSSTIPLWVPALVFTFYFYLQFLIQQSNA